MNIHYAKNRCALYLFITLLSSISHLFPSSDCLVYILNRSTGSFKLDGALVHPLIFLRHNKIKNNCITIDTAGADADTDKATFDLSGFRFWMFDVAPDGKVSLWPFETLYLLDRGSRKYAAYIRKRQ